MVGLGLKMGVKIIKKSSIFIFVFFFLLVLTFFTSAEIVLESNTGEAYIAFNTTNQERFRITPFGRFGFNTTTPSVAFDIGGGTYTNLTGAKAINSVGITGNLEVLGYLYSDVVIGTYSVQSDNDPAFEVTNSSTYQMFSVNTIDGSVNVTGHIANMQDNDLHSELRVLDDVYISDDLWVGDVIQIGNNMPGTSYDYSRIGSGTKNAADVLTNEDLYITGSVEIDDNLYVGDNSSVDFLEIKGSLDIETNKATDAFNIRQLGSGNIILANGSNINHGMKLTTSGQFMVGDSAVASGNTAIALGSNVIASGDYALASGRRAKALQNGAFALSDSTNADFEVDQINTFGARFDEYWLTGGNVGIGTTSPGTYKLSVVGGDAHFDENVWINQNLFLKGNLTRYDVQNLFVNGSIVPPELFTNQFDIGNATNRWRDGWFNNDIYLGEYLYHADDTDTYIKFSDNRFEQYAGSISIIDADTSELTINTGQADLDTRIKTQTDANLFFVDASNNSLGIGTDTPQNKLDVEGSVAIGSSYSGSSSASANGLIVEGNVGIGTTNPSAKLDVEVSSGGAATIGSSSNVATGNYAVAIGNGAEASGASSFASGSSTVASGAVSTAMGQETVASQWASTAMGLSTNASGNYATAMGWDTTASGTSSTAMGLDTTASGNYAIAMGSHTTASGARSTAMGEATIASGVRSTAIGSAVTVSGENSVGIGLDSTSRTVAQANTFSVVGGSMGINTVAPDSALEINSATGNNLRLSYNDQDGSAVNRADFTLKNDGTLTIASSGTNPDINVSTQNYNNAIYIDDSTNKIGIGTNTPSAGLDIGGGTLSNISGNPIDLLVKGDAEINGRLYVGGTQIYSSSDIGAGGDLNVDGNVTLGDNNQNDWVNVTGTLHTSGNMIELDKDGDVHLKKENPKIDINGMRIEKRGTKLVISDA
jgi:hypothetical protein